MDCSHAVLLIVYVKQNRNWLDTEMCKLVRFFFSNGEKKMKKNLVKVLSKYLNFCTENEIERFIEVPPVDSMGDYAIPCFSFAKKSDKNPMLIAQDIKKVLDVNKDFCGIESVQCINGYCNVYMNREKATTQIIEKAMLPGFGVRQVGAEKVICMDYSSPNIAKNFHVGHLRTTIIGNSLYKIYEKLGYKVIRINHLGDWGTQFGKLIVAYKKWSSKEEVEQKGIEELLRIYVKCNSMAEEQPELLDEARAWFVKMERNDEEALAIWNWFKDISMVEYERVYNKLGMTFDYYIGESFYRDKVPALVDELKSKNLLVKSEGAQVVNLDECHMPACMILKNDGGSIYHSRDIAAILYRKESYNFDKCIYVTGLEQSLHFKQVFKVIELMGYDWYKELIHVPYGLVSLEGEKLSTRTGNIIYAEDILNEAIKRAYDAILDKNVELENKEKVAKQVGVGAIIFHDLFNQRIKNVDFKWDEVLSFDGTTGPYIQYTYARANSVLKKAVQNIHMRNVEFKLLVDDISYKLIKVIDRYEATINAAAENYEPSIIAHYAINLATEFNRFYHECNILRSDDETKKARLAVVYVAAHIIKESCELLGMECPDEM